MFSLIITVRSIAAVARLGCDGVLSAIKAYLQHTADNQVHDADYSIPSLIWPPPIDLNNYVHLLSGGATYA
ncbi:MAG: hypothetical protein MUQ51_07555 [Pseudomonadota bacterium]|nr:hypothetical protein [Pseudomonadota bacterium]MDO7711457.1 hypothetical protein [Pseudomonadota bacterium]